MPVYDRTNIPIAVSRGKLDPELEAWLPTGPVLGADIDIAQGRRDHKQLGVGPWPVIGSVDTLVLPGPHGSLAVRRHVPTEATSQPSGALIYIHGGGFTYGTLDEFEVPMRLIAEQAGIRTYVVEYQLAPEAKYPTQIDEIQYVVRWLFDHAADEGVDPAKIGLGGDSAGGNMTCVLALKLRDTAGPRLALQVPLFPEAAFPADTPAASENRTGLYLESNGIFSMVRNLVTNADDVRHPYLTPMNAESHADLPPAILVTNGYDPLRDVGHAYAQQLAAAGNDLTYVHNPDLTHGFIQFTRWSHACHTATIELAELIKKRIG
jgi:acetyl esterase